MNYRTRNRPCCGPEKTESPLERSLLQRAAVDTTPVTDVPPVVHDVLATPGRPLDAGARAALEPRLGHDFSRVRVHTGTLAAGSAQAVRARAYTVGQHLVFAPEQYAPGTSSGQRLLAHELAHVMQQERGAASPRAATPAGLTLGQRGDGLERAAERAADAVARGGVPGSIPIAGQVGPLLQRDDHVPSPLDERAVTLARARLRLMEQFLDEWTVREARRLSIAEERNRLLARRLRLDTEGVEFGAPGSTIATEEARIGSINRRPLDIQVGEDEVRLRMRFQVRFEDARLASRLAELRGGLQAGADIVWNQRLTGQVFGDRRLVVEPSVTAVSTTAGRDLNYWLITVRPTNQSPVTYPGCTLDQPPPGTPTSVTDPNCAGGVMSIPPSHMSLGGVLGHEMLHLFGLLDRYRMDTHIIPGQRPVTVTDPTRETGGRRDPLGSEDAPILAEDLAFLFDRLGIYELEAGRGLDVLRRLEGHGLSMAAVRIEIERLREIIRLGYDPRSLIRPRRDFNDRIIQEAENL